MPAIRIANAPCSWGALEFDWAGPAPSYERVLDEMASAGYAGTELGDWGFMPTDPRALADELDRRHLTLLGAFVPVALTMREAHPDGIARAIRVAELLAKVNGRSPFVVLADDTARDVERTRLAGRVTAAQGLDNVRWATLTDGAMQVARRVRDATGLRTVFHHHCATFVETPAEIDRLMGDTDSGLVGLCLDTGHCTFGGGDAVATATKWRDRIWHLHLKDCDPNVHRRSVVERWDYPRAVREGIFCELGRGAVAFREVLSVLTSGGYDGWAVVEQDVLPALGTPAASAARNRAYLRSIGV
jgi:inosose dehydratase